jgi:hypothetical protein
MWCHRLTRTFFVMLGPTHISNRIKNWSRNRDSSVGVAIGWTTTPALSASCPLCTGDSFPGDNAARAWSWQITSNKCRVQEYRICLNDLVLN